MHRSFALALAALLAGCAVNTDQVTRSDALPSDLSGEDLTALLQTLKDTIDGLQSDVTTLNTENTTLRERVAALESEVGDVDGGFENSRIDDAEEEIAANASQITGNGSDIATNAADIAVLEGALDDGAGGTIDVTAFDGRIADLETEVGDATNNFATSRIDTLEGDHAATDSGLSALDGRVTANEGAITALDGRVTGAEASIDGLEATVGNSGAGLVLDVNDLMADLTAAEGDIATLEGALDDGGGGLLDVDAELALRVATVTTNQTVNVSTAGELLDALDDLDTLRIGQQATYTIQLATGFYDLPGSLELGHPDGGRVALIGETGSASDVALRFSGTDGLLIQNSSALGYVNGITIQQQSAPTGVGVMVRRNSMAWLGPDVRVQGFGLGVQSVGASHLIAEGVELVDNTTAAAAYEGSVLALDGATVTATNGQDGIQCNDNSFVDARNLNPLSGFSRYGMVVNRGGVIQAYGSSFSGNGTDMQTPGDWGNAILF